MSAHESYSQLVNSRAPRLAPGATTQSFKTWSSIDQELAHSPIPHTANGKARLHGARGKQDRALFPAIRSTLEPAQLREALLNILLVGGAVGLIVTVAAAALIAPYILFFMET